MVQDLENERIQKELQDGDCGDHPRDVVEDTLEEGAPVDYEDTGELLTDISAAAQKIEERDDIEDTRDRAPGLVEEFCSELHLTDQALNHGKTILDNLNQETYSKHEADAIAGASTYVSTLFTNEKVTTDEIVEVGGIENYRLTEANNEIRSQVTGDGNKPASDLPI
jgi:transcription initiation factor TFIIIB Brf1 subunit/transcription initiation factor TFIIB